MKTLLVVLPFAGLILTTFSSIWGLRHELYTKDEKNRRHLTLAGTYSIAFALLGLFISFNTAVLKTIIDNQDAQSAREADDRKARATALEKLADQQEEAAKELRRREDIRETRDKLDREAQIQRDNDIAQRQRDIALSQQQLEGFTKVESLAKKQTLNELERANNTLWDIRRSQYPFPGDLLVRADIKISSEHPLLTQYAKQVEAETPDHNGLIRINNTVRTIFEDLNNIPSLLRGELLFVNVYGAEARIENVPPDIKFYYFASVFNYDLNKDPYFGNLFYSVKSHNFLMLTVMRHPEAFVSTGKLSSLLDLPGTTMVVHCSGGCSSYVSLDSIELKVPSGITLEVKGFKNVLINRENVLIHKFDPDKEKFLEQYSRKPLM